MERGKQNGDTAFEEAPVVALWIDGRAYLTVTPAFGAVVGAGGAIVRRVPLCGENELNEALDAAAAGGRIWRDFGAHARRGALVDLAAAVQDYATHLTGLIAEESALEAAAARSEVDAAAEFFAAPSEATAAGAGEPLVGIVGNRQRPLSGLLRRAAPRLLAGAALILRPDPQAPSAVIALAELATRCGLPNGVVNVIHGDARLIEAMRASAAAQRMILLFA